MGLRIDYKAGEGTATLPKRLADEGPLLRVDVIGCWLLDLEVLYSEAAEELEAINEALDGAKVVNIKDYLRGGKY